MSLLLPSDGHSNRFRSYTEIKSVVSRHSWAVARYAVLLATLATTAYVWIDPARGLMLFWQLLIPALPLVFSLVPGLWRQVCPMALLNQIPIEQNLSKGRTLPALLQDKAYILAVALFVGAILLRRPWLTTTAGATVALIVAALAASFLGGLVYKGRSGWCGTFCPLEPIQKLYGHAPPVIVPNGYCPTCVGCQRNCYDFNPVAAIHADLSDLPPEQIEHRALFAGLLPGLILAAWLADPYGIGGPIRYLIEAGGYILASLGAYMAARALLPLSLYRITAIFGALALITFYAFEAAPMAGAISALSGVQLPYPATGYVIMAAAVAVAANGLSLGFADERAYHASLAQSGSNDVADGPAAGLGVEDVALQEGRRIAARALLRERSSGRSMAVDPHRSLLEILESNGHRLEFGCRMGQCGADPLIVLDGSENLNPPDSVETATLERLGLLGKARLACMCRAAGPVEIDAGPQARAALASHPATREHATDSAKAARDPVVESGIRNVVILGNGVAGTTFAERLRRASPGCRIDIVTREGHHFYNRMALGRAIAGRSGLERLQLLPSDWAERHDITVWLSTLARHVDPDRKAVQLGTGETLTYDKLVLATGAAARHPDIPGADLTGTFVLREADDALQLRRWLQSIESREALVVGGGVLGIETAGILAGLGYRTTLIVRGERLMGRHLDRKGGEILARFLASRGIDVRLNVKLTGLTGGKAGIESAHLSDGTNIAVATCVFCVGSTPDLSLARSAGLSTDRGVLVDDAMRTSKADILAIGDIAQPAGTMEAGLWPIAAAQAERAIAGLLQDTPLDGSSSSTVTALESTAIHLKLDGISVRAFGRPCADPKRVFHADPAASDQEQRLIVEEEDRIVSAVFVGPPRGDYSFSKLMKTLSDQTPLLRRIRTGDWTALV